MSGPSTETTSTHINTSGELAGLHRRLTVIPASADERPTLAEQIARLVVRATSDVPTALSQVLGPADFAAACREAAVRRVEEHERVRNELASKLRRARELQAVTANRRDEAAARARRMSAHLEDCDALLERAGELTNDAAVEGDQRDPRRPNNRVTTRVPAMEPPAPPTPPTPEAPPTPALPEPADLTIAKTASRGELLGRGAIRYVVRVVNRGPATATGVRVVDTPSLPIRVGSLRVSQGRCAVRRGVVRCELGTLAPAAQATITFVARPQAPGTLRNSASVTGEAPDPNPADNIDGALTRVRGLLRIRKAADRGRVRAGAQVRYRITVTNASGFALRRVRVCDRLPAGMAAVGARPRGALAGGQRCWTVARLGAGRSRTFHVTARVLRGASGRLVNRASATAPGARAVAGRGARDRAPLQVVAGRVRAGGVTG